MQQKEILLIVGALVVGFFLLNNNGMLSGLVTMNNNIITSPQGYKSSLEEQWSVQGLSATETLPCPGVKTLEDINCANWVNKWFWCDNVRVSCHCDHLDNCKVGGFLSTPTSPAELSLASANALNNMGEPNCPSDCTKTSFFHSFNYIDLETKQNCVRVWKTIICTPSKND